MKYPGVNTIKISNETVMRMLEEKLEHLDSAIRVTNVDNSYSGLVVTFTTDKEKPNDAKTYSDALEIVSRWDSANNKLISESAFKSAQSKIIKSEVVKPEITKSESELL